MQLDRNRIVIRERGWLDLLDLALGVIRAYAWPLIVTLAIGILPAMRFNEGGLSGRTEGEFDETVPA